MIQSKAVAVLFVLAGLLGFIAGLALLGPSLAIVLAALLARKAREQRMI